MAELTQVLDALNTKEAVISTADLAKELTASMEGTRKQLTRLKEKKYVEGDSKEGWLITAEGRKILEKGGVRPSMIGEGVTPRQQFEAIGRLIGIPEDRIVLATGIVWSGDYNDVNFTKAFHLSLKLSLPELARQSLKRERTSFQVSVEAESISL
ncbi:hypothetical protein ES703_82457 [subsurface metagenome]